MKILVTGGAGFIGSHIVDKLVDQHEVIVVDNLSTGKLNNVNSKATFFNMDISSNEIEKLFPIDVIIHQAAQVDVSKSILDPVFDAQVNIIGGLKLLELARKYNSKFIYGNSGGATIGEAEYYPVDEKHPKNPLVPYGLSKLTFQKYLELYSKLFNLKYVSLNYANVYGPRQDPFGEGGVVAIFANKVSKNENPIIFGDGKQTRDFVYVEDVANANVMAIDWNNNSLNVSTGIETSLLDLIQVYKEISKKEITSEFKDPRKGDIFRSVLDCKKIKSLGWNNLTSLNKGIKKTFEWVENENRSS